MNKKEKTKRDHDLDWIILESRLENIMENQKMNKTQVWNKSEKEEIMKVICEMIDHFDIICEMIKHAKFNPDGKRKQMVYYSIIGLQQIYDQIEHLEKMQER